MYRTILNARPLRALVCCALIAFAAPLTALEIVGKNGKTLNLEVISAAPAGLLAAQINDARTMVIDWANLDAAWMSQHLPQALPLVGVTAEHHLWGPLFQTDDRSIAYPKLQPMQAVRLPMPHLPEPSIGPEEWFEVRPWDPEAEATTLGLFFSEETGYLHRVIAATPLIKLDALENRNIRQWRRLQNTGPLHGMELKSAREFPTPHILKRTFEEKGDAPYGTYVTHRWESATHTGSLAVLVFQTSTLNQGGDFFGLGDELYFQFAIATQFSAKPDSENGVN